MANGSARKNGNAGAVGQGNRPLRAREAIRLVPPLILGVVSGAAAKVSRSKDARELISV